MQYFWKNPLKALPVLLLLAAYAGAVFGAAGNAQFVIGDVKVINKAGVTRALVKGGEVDEGDRIVTAAGASAQIKMVDGGFIAVRPNTNLGFDSYHYAGKDDGKESAVLSLLQGGFRTITGIIGHTDKQNYLIKTETATIGIRGTDHEPMVILTPAPGQVAIAEPGTYDKVNVGIAYIRTDAGSIDIQRNQVGFAPISRAAPVILPSLPPFYKPTPAPGPQKAAAPAAAGEEQKAEASASSRDKTVVDPTSAVATAPAAVPVAAAPTVVVPVVAVTATDASGTTLNATTQTQTTSTGTVTPIAPATGGSTTPTPTPTGPTGGPFAAYSPTFTEVEAATQFSTSQIGSGSLVAPADLTYTGGGLSSFTNRDIGGGGSNTYSVIGASTPVTANATSFASTGVQFGRWTSATALQASYTTPLGTQSGAPTTWIYGPQGYLDTPVVPGANTGPLTGTFSYALDGSTAPYDMQSGRSGTLTAASVSANFTNQTASASLALNVGGQAWSATTPTPVSFGYSNMFFASSYPGGTGNNLTVSMGAGTPAACPTCSGNLSGAFTGQNYAGAILSYDLWDNSNSSGDIVGHVALVRTGTAVTNGTPAPTGTYLVGDYGGSIQTAQTIGTTGGVLTSYGWGSSTVLANGFYSTTVNCTTCSVTPATNATTSAAPTGIYFGTWDSGAYTATWETPFSTELSTRAGGPQWITGPEAGPLYLPNALTGTKAFAVDGGMVTNANGATGTVLGTTALTVDFTKQAVGINIDLSVNDTATTPTAHSWNAKTLPGNEVAINSSKGLGGATFYASSYNGAGPGALTVTVDGTTPGNGDVSGQLTGTGLNGAIISYDLNALLGGTTASTFEQASGVAAFVGSTSNVATPYRYVMISATDPTSIISQPVLGIYANNTTRILSDTTGNLTQFDMNQINNNNGSNNASHTLSSGTSVLTDYGTDSTTGISWGRWAGGSINIANRIDATIKTQPLAGSLHWIAGPVETAAVTLPLSGTFSYVNAGGTAPTDNLGNVGTLNSASLTANFTAQTVDVGVQTTIASSTLTANATAVPIIQRTAFAAGPNMPVNLSVTCTGACGTTQQGAIVGGFTGAGATGAAMMYSLEKVGGANASITSGVVAFHR
jgi:hypothetical protein